MAQGDGLFLLGGSKENTSTFKQRFCNVFVYPFSKSRFYRQWKPAPMDIRFRLTNKCDDCCARCFECSGPKNNLDIVPVKDVEYYANVQNGQYKSVCMTGGEWSLIYDKEPHYMAKIFDKLDLSKSDEYIIQTNAGWMNDSKSEQILRDLKQVQSKLGKHGKTLKLDTSVDRYRSQRSLEGVVKLIRAVAVDPEFEHTKIRILSCGLDRGLTNNVVLKPEFFEPYGITLTFQARDIKNPFFQICYANNTRIVIHEEGVTMQIGRAKQNNFGYKIYYPELQCNGLQPEDPLMELSLREDGMIKWHNWYDWNIMVPYKDANGQNKPIEQIRQELIDMAWHRNLRYNIKNALLEAIPVFGLLRQLHINRQMKESFDKNYQRLTFVGRRVK